MFKAAVADTLTKRCNWEEQDGGDDGGGFADPDPYGEQDAASIRCKYITKRHPPSLGPEPPAGGPARYAHAEQHVAFVSWAERARHTGNGWEDDAWEPPRVRRGLAEAKTGVHVSVSDVAASMTPRKSGGALKQ